MAHWCSDSRCAGAPAIAIVAALSVAVELHKRVFGSVAELVAFVKERLEYLKTSRPTAVNLFEAAGRLAALADTLAGDTPDDAAAVKQGLIGAMEGMLAADISDNKAIGAFGRDAILAAAPAGEAVRVLTHCNTGSLATAGYGTALGVIRALHESGRLEGAFCTETRPYNQGARLTAYELVYEKIPATLVTDSMVSMLMQRHRISAVVVGADRVVANGDTANKVGTYQIAIAARYHNVPFYVAAPLTSVDLSLPSGDRIVIEERPEKELTHVNGMQIAASGIKAWNPSFDVTPAALITGIITERGIATKAAGSDIFDMPAFVRSVRP